jgi:competence protein ComEC
MPQPTTQPAPLSPISEPLRFHFLPLFFAAVCFSCGILIARFVWLNPGLLLVAALLCAAVCAIAAYLAQRVSLLPLAGLFLLLGAFCSESAPQPAPQTRLALLADGTQRTIEGSVIKMGPIRRVESALPFSDKIHEEKSQQLQLALISVSGENGGMVPLHGGLSLTLYAPLETAFPRIVCGETVHAALTMRQPDRYLDPGVWDERAYMLNEGIGALGSAKLVAFSVVTASPHPSLTCRLHTLQQDVSSRLIAFAEEQSPSSKLPAFFQLNHEDATMLTAMLTGDRSYLSRGVRTGFERTGSFHLLVVSGMHLAIFAGLIFFIAKAVRLPRLAATFTTISSCILLCPVYRIWAPGTALLLDDHAFPVWETIVA